MVRKTRNASPAPSSPHSIRAPIREPQTWVVDDSVGGLRQYVGYAEQGLEFRRHTCDAKPGMWLVAITGWGTCSDAVVNDFGDLVQVVDRGLGR